MGKFWSLYYFSKFLISLNFLLNYSALLFSLSLLGILTNRRSFLLFLLCLEILLLSLILRLISQDFLGELISFILLLFAAAESALALSLLLNHQRKTGTTSVIFFNLIKG